MSENLPSQLQETLLLAPQSHYDPDPNAIMFYSHEEIQQNVLQHDPLNDSLKQIIRIN
jgi:hypothetical protein